MEESWDVSSEVFSDLINRARDVAVELRRSRIIRRGRLQIRLDAKQQLTISRHYVDPYHLAEENALYPPRYAKKFARNKPFILVFTMHPWFNTPFDYDDVGGADTALTRSLARRAFMQFSGDPTPLSSIARQVRADATIADASRLLSAIFFVNAWPRELDSAGSPTMPSWLYLNPRATHRMDRGRIEVFCSLNPHATCIDDFASDDY